MSSRRTRAKCSNFDLSSTTKSKLISLVNARPDLWDSNLASYKTINNKDRRKLWDEVSDALGIDGMTGIICKTKWQNLRNQFNQVNKKLYDIKTKFSADEASEQMNPIWPFYYEMQFVLSTKEHSPNDSNLDFSTQQTNNGQASEHPIYQDGQPEGAWRLADYNTVDQDIEGDTQFVQTVIQPPIVSPSSNRPTLKKENGKAPTRLDILVRNVQMEERTNKLIEFDIQKRMGAKQTEKRKYDSPQALFLVSFERDLIEAGEDEHELRYQIMKAIRDFKETKKAKTSNPSSLFYSTHN